MWGQDLGRLPKSGWSSIHSSIKTQGLAPHSHGMGFFSTRKTIPSVWPRDCFDGHVMPGSLLLPNPSVFGSLELIWGGLWSQYSLDLIG